MNLPLKISTLPAILGFTLTVWSYNSPLKAATLDMDSSTTDMNSEMVDLGPADAQYDLRFIDFFVPHHQTAIEVAEDALSKSQRPEIQEISQNIIDTQSGEITQMLGWRQAWYPNAGSPPESEMVDLGPADAQYDLRFIDFFVPHHQTATEVAEDALNKSQRPEILEISQNIIDTQSRERNQMLEWRQAWYPNAGPVAAVPEPTSTLGLMAFGAFGIAAMLKRKQKKAA